MKNCIKTLAVLSALALATSVQASISVSTSSSSSWVGTPAFETGAAPETDSGGTINDNENWWASLSGGVNGFGSIAETFYLTAPGQLKNIQMVFAGGTETFSISLYDLGTVSDFSSAALGTNSYPNSSNSDGNNAQANFVPTTSSRSAVDLLNPGDQFTYTTVASDVLYTLTPTETVNLKANEMYAVALDPTDSSASGTWWRRGGVESSNPLYQFGMAWSQDSATYAYAYQDFAGHNSGTSGVRNQDMAVCIIPYATVTITNVSYSSGSTVLSWNPGGSGTYSVLRTNIVSAPRATWPVIQTGLTSTTYTDTGATGANNFYIITSP
ncbi:MAG: hypothetical protein ABSE97_06780 [Verrucomicrobiota bacterium]|jgi:hypothetical protein